MEVLTAKFFYFFVRLIYTDTSRTDERAFLQVRDSEVA
jgi:hypothetical protein